MLYYHINKRSMKKKVIVMLAAILTICGTTMFTSCTPSDNPAPQQDESLTAKLAGQWIVEMTADEVKTASVADGVALPAGGDKFVYICQFDSDGAGWEEFNVLKDGTLIDQPFDRYGNDFSYQISADGKVTVKLSETDSQKAFIFDGNALRHVAGDKVTVMVPATAEQSQMYKKMSDDWHGGSDEAIDLSKLYGTYIAKDGEEFTGTITPACDFYIEDGATITLNNADLSYYKLSTDFPSAGITCEGNATIILKGSNKVVAFAVGYPGIFVPEEYTLTIKGSGSLYAEGINGAGIGSGDNYEANADAGNIVLEGGTIHAVGGQIGAGIGTADGTCGDITIKKTVTSVIAQKGYTAENYIGTGTFRGTCGKITIEEGAVVEERSTIPCREGSSPFSGKY